MDSADKRPFAHSVSLCVVRPPLVGTDEEGMKGLRGNSAQRYNDDDDDGAPYVCTQSPTVCIPRDQGPAYRTRMCVRDREGVNQSVAVVGSSSLFTSGPRRHQLVTMQCMLPLLA